LPAFRRNDGRRADQLRPTAIVPNILIHPAGSVRMESGDTHVICTACIEEDVPDFLIGRGRGWVTAEYGMLPGSTHSRKDRRPDGRMQEIRRLIGRCLRGVVDTRKLGERTIRIDCDVIQADGGTRTASVTGAYVALALAVQRLRHAGQIKKNPIQSQVAAVSVGVVRGQVLLDLDYSEDGGADVDMNVAMTSGDGLVEVQATAEKVSFDRDHLNAMLDLAARGCRRLFKLQRQALRES
jgi:ribonuclease PH